MNARLFSALILKHGLRGAIESCTLQTMHVVIFFLPSSSSLLHFAHPYHKYFFNEANMCADAV